MNDPLCVAVSNGLEHLLDDACCFLFTEEAALGNFIEEFSSRAELSDVEVTFFILEHFKEFHNIGVIQESKDLQFLEELCLFLYVHLILLNDLDSPLCSCLAVEACPHLSKGP